MRVEVSHDGAIQSVIMSNDIEAVRHGPAEGETPPCPATFGIEYRPPPHRTKRLEQLFPHERDRQIVFHELPHVYVVNGKCMNLSVTTLAGEHAEHFDEDEAIDKMKTSRREAWPKLKYARGVALLPEGADVPDEHGGVLVAGAQSGCTFAAGVPIDRRGARREMSQASRERNKRDEAVDVYSYERACTDDEIKQLWEDNRVDGSNRGTEAHLQMELWLNSEPCRNEEPEVANGLRFVKEQLLPLGLKAYRTEWEIHADAEGIAGSIDFVGRLPSGNIVIVDWKRCGKLKDDVTSSFKKFMHEPLRHLDDCSGAKYTLQLSIYAWILEKYYGEIVEGLALCSLHPDATFHTWMPYLKEEAAYLMHTCRVRRAELERATHEAAEHDLPYCALEGDALHDGVKGADGTLYNRKPFQAAFPETPCVEAVAETAKVQRFLRGIDTPGMDDERAKLGACRTWKERVPSTGHSQFRSCREL